MSNLHKVRDRKTIFWPTHLIGAPEKMGTSVGALNWRDRHMVAFAGPGDILDLDRRADRLIATLQESKLDPVDKGTAVKHDDLCKRIEANPRAVLESNGLVASPRRMHNTLGRWLSVRGLTKDDIEPKAAKPEKAK